MEDVASIGMIGFGEAGAAFAGVLSPEMRNRMRVYDWKTDIPATAPAKLAEYQALPVSGVNTAQEVVRGAALVLSLVTADQSLAAAESVCGALERHAIFCDMNSVAPQTKRAAADRIEKAGGRYADVAIMAPVHPARLGVPLLVSGSQAEAATEALRAVGFTDVRAIGGKVGDVSAIKMIRSVMIKGIEALSAECFLAAAVAGVSEEVIASLDASWPGADWARRGDYSLDRMLVHGRRRAAELDEVVRTLAGLELSGGMARATAEWQRALGNLALTAPPEGLAAKTSAILASKARAA